MQKAIRILTTILVLSILASVYNILIAPLLEPASKYKKMETSGSDEPPTDSQIMALFSPDDWEVNSFRHLNYKNIHVLAGDYKFLSSESISIDKCTVVFLDPDNSSKAIIVQCKGTIILDFEKSILHGFKDDNRILGGKLNGKIRVVSKGEENNVTFETQDFNIDKGRIWTNANVNFKYGRTQGVGSGMQIQLINRGLFGSKKEKGSNSPILDKIENVTINKLQRLTIFPPTNAQNNNHNDQTDLFSSPIELHCDGPFVFNALSNNATFEQNVSLIQMVSNKAPNSIRCQSLKLFFATPKRVNKKASNSKPKSATQSPINEWNLQLERLEALGPLVVIEAPEYQTKIHTSRLIATLSPLSFELDSSNRQNEIYYKNCLVSTQNLFYSVGENGRLGTMECNCPGWISAPMDQDGKQVRIRWSDRLRLEPDQKYPNENIVSIQGSARMELEKDNRSEASILADNIYFWISQKSESSTSNADKLTVSRMHANKKVILKSNPITAQVKTLQLWFDDLGGKEQGGLEGSNVVSVANEITHSPSGEPNKQYPSSGSPIDNNLLSAASSNSYSVVGELLRGKILLGQGQPQIAELILENDVRVVQNNALINSDNSSGRLEMSGSQIQIFNLTLPSASAALIGEPAKIRYNNTLLTGSIININRGTNRIWINSEGEAIFLGELQEEGEGSNSGNRQEAVGNSAQAAWTPAKINWSESMEFQDDTLTFNGKVCLQKKNQFAQCNSMSITLNKKIDFQNLNSAELQNSIDVRFIVLNSSVRLENETVENGVTAAVDCLTTSKLTINMKDQTFVADGPGRAMTQRRLGNKPEAENGVEDSTADSLINLSVNFQKRLDGAFDTRSLQTFVFSGQVEAVYSPIDEIGKTVTTFKIEELPPQAFILQCDNMEIQANLGSRQEAVGSGDLTAANSTTRNSQLAAAKSAFIASGGVDLTGLTKDRLIYNANADKITYEGKNGMITLEGDGQRPAFISCQKIWNGRRSEASSSVIYYNTQTGAVRGEGIQEFSLFLSPKN
ncbi:MAG: hypothetical protein IJQ39_08440 [Thermoguttaceae bacterium]|nr:hypothetical protein [Thermoguttaceae bacterium]